MCIRDRVNCEQAAQFHPGSADVREAGDVAIPDILQSVTMATVAMFDAGVAAFVVQIADLVAVEPHVSPDTSVQPSGFGVLFASTR